MNLKAKHPCFDRQLPDWVLIRDSYRGERIMKEKGTVYLPYTSSMLADGVQNATSKGSKMYEAYRLRAVYPELVKAAADAMVGLMHRKPPVIKLPSAMEPMRERATLNGESLPVLLRAINEEQLLVGRLGLLADIPTGAAATALPHIVSYSAEGVSNWATSLDADGRQVLSLVVLDESGDVMGDDLSWQKQDKFRLLVAGAMSQRFGGNGDYRTGLAVGSSDLDPNALVTPSLGGRTLDKLPFVLIGAKDLVPEPDVPPLLNVARLCVTIYRSEADYRQALFMQAQPTLAIIGATDSGDDEDQRVGAGAVLEISQGGDAKYVEVSGAGLGEMRQALENDYRRAAESGAQLLEARGKSAESGDALRVRVAARTATLANVAMTGAEGLQQILRICAEWRGLNPEEVIVQPNLDFVEDEFNAQDLVYWMDARSRGAPASLKTIHRWLQRKDVSEMEFEEEVAQIKKESSFADSLLGPEPKSALPAPPAAAGAKKPAGDKKKAGQGPGA